jgi:hypothetical protein
MKPFYIYVIIFTVIALILDIFLNFLNFRELLDFIPTILLYVFIFTFLVLLTFFLGRAKILSIDFFISFTGFLMAVFMILIGHIAVLMFLSAWGGLELMIKYNKWQLERKFKARLSMTELDELEWALNKKK